MKKKHPANNELKEVADLPTEQADLANVNTSPTIVNQTDIEVDPEADKDAGTKEIVAYVLGGTANQIASSDLYLKQNLMMFVLNLNPVLISFMGVFGMIWDAITDPIMANISDNSRNRWGRRRPFILFGGVVAAIASIFIWYYFPKSDKIKKNKPDIPVVSQSDDSLEKFGNMMSGYGISKVKLKLNISNNYIFVSNGKTNGLDDIVKNSLKKMKAGISIVDDKNEKALPLTLSTKGFESNPPDDKIIGREMSSSVSLGKNITVKNNLKIEPEYEENRSIFKVLEDIIKSRHKYIGLNFDGYDIDFNFNTFEQSGLYRARVSLLEKTIIEALGKYYKLPYWKVFPKVSDQKEKLRNTLLISDNISTQRLQGFSRSDINIYDNILDSLISSIEKRKKYNEIKEALNKKVVDENIKEILKNQKLDEKQITAFENGFKAGKLSNEQINEINKNWLKVSPEEIAEAKKELLKEHNGDLYSAYKDLHTKVILYGLGHKIDMNNYAFSDEDNNTISNLLKKGVLISGTNLYSSLWSELSNPFDKSEVKVKLDPIDGAMGSLRFLKSSSFLNKFNNPKFKGEKPGMLQKVIAGLHAYGKDPRDDKVFLYMMIALIIMATFNTIGGVPYYALGIELAPSYNGRTKLVAFRSVMGQIIGFTRPWLFPFVLLPFFIDAIDGAFYLAIVCAAIAIPLLVYSVTHTKERIKLDITKKKIPFWTSIKYTLKIPEFWRVVALYFIMQKSLGIFRMVGGYLIIYYVFNGALLQGASYIAIVGSLGIGLALLNVPFIAWICNKYEKHNALRFAIVMMMIGTALNWWCYNPNHPALLFIVPFFFSIGISSMYNVMSTLMADVTDVDELRTGSRREGMFGAMNATIMKATGPIGAVAAGIVVVMCGFDVDLGPFQKEGVFTTMRLMFSFAPTVLLSFCLLLLYKYPLTRKRMYEIKAILKERRASGKENVIANN